MFRKAIPVLPAPNIRQTIDFFEAKLGFTATSFGNYAILKFKNTEIHLSMPANKTNYGAVSCLILVENIEDLYVSFCARGLLSLKDKLSDKPWGLKEFAITDNNNNLIRFGEKR